MEIKRFELEFDHSAPSNAEEENGETIPPLPHKSAWRDA
jgi:hypothetical protein